MTTEEIGHTGPTDAEMLDDEEPVDEPVEDEVSAEPDDGDPIPINVPDEDIEAARASLTRSLVTLGFVAFDGQGTDNTSSGVLVSEELRRHFRRDTYVGIEDPE